MCKGLIENSNEGGGVEVPRNQMSRIYSESSSYVSSFARKKFKC